MLIPKDSEPESPRDRLAKYGVDSLSIQELLAVLLFPGYRRDKAIEITANLIELFSATIEQLTQKKRLGLSKPARSK